MPAHKKDVTAQFNKFAGKEVQATEITTQTEKWGPVTRVEIAENDPTVSALRAAVKKAGFKLRLWIPGGIGTMDFRTDRVNAHVEKGADGKFRIASEFSIG